MRIRELRPLPRAALLLLERESAREGHRFLARLLAEHDGGTARFDRPGEVLLGAFDGADLVGVGGLSRDPYGERPGIGRIRHVFVRASHRRRGVGRALLAALESRARPWYSALELRTDTPGGAAFYAAAGFSAADAVPTATHRRELSDGGGAALLRAPGSAGPPVFDPPMSTSTTRLARRIEAPRAAVYRALIDPEAVAAWMVPDGMTSRVHRFEAREGGRFRISLTYDEPTESGKTTAHTDTYHGRFVRLVADEEVVQVMEFETDDAALRGEMRVTFTLVEAGGGTEVRAVHEHVPRGVPPADNELGWRMALDKLAALVESGGRGARSADEAPAGHGAVFEERFAVRWGDLDANHHVRNTIFSEFATHTRFRLLETHGFPQDRFESLRFGPVLFREEIRYRRELLFGEEATVDVRFAGLAEDGSQWRARQEVTRADGKQAAVLLVDGAWIHLDSRRLVAPPADLLDLLRTLPRTADFEAMRSVLRSAGAAP